MNFNGLILNAEDYDRVEQTVRPIVEKDCPGRPDLVHATVMEVHRMNVERFRKALNEGGELNLMAEKAHWLLDLLDARDRYRERIYQLIADHGGTVIEEDFDQIQAEFPEVPELDVYCGVYGSNVCFPLNVEE